MTGPVGFRRRGAHDRGAVIPLVALLLPVLMVMTAMAVDLGRQRSSRRDMQAAADVISLDMARLADGRTLDQINAGDAEHLDAATALAQSAARNDVTVAQLSLDWGTWDATTGYTSVNGVGTAVPDAAWVVAEEDTDYFFQPGTGHVEREAIGANSAATYAGFSIGSFAVAPTDPQAGLLHGILTPLLGNPVGLSVASYKSLAAISLGVADLGVELGLLTPTEVLNTAVPLDEFMLAAASVMRNQGSVAEANLLEGMITTEISALAIRIGDLVSAEDGSESAAMGATVDIISAFRTAAFLAECDPTPVAPVTDCNALTLPTLSIATPILNSSGELHLIENPRYHYGPVGTGTETAQFRVDDQLTLGAQQVGQCVPSLANAFCVIGGLLYTFIDVAVSADVSVELSGADATIADIDCDDPAALGLTLDSFTDLYQATVSVTVEFGKRALLGGNLGQSLGSMVLSGSTVADDSADSVLFTVAPDVLSTTQRQTGLGDAGLSSITLTAGGTGVLGTLANLGINLTTAQVIANWVTPLLTQIDGQHVQALADLMGVNIAGADLTAEAIDCGVREVDLVL